jgi:hypothetical protein
MEILQQIQGDKWDRPFPANVHGEATAGLEQGKILLMPQLPFKLFDHELELLAPALAHPKAKNISYDARSRRLRCAPCSDVTRQEIQALLQRFATAADTLVRNLLPAYAPALQTGRSSLRVVEIAGRASSYRKDDTRLHVDAFPATPNQGRRILRVFANINPHGSARVWRVGEPFEEVARRFLPKVPKQFPGYAALLKTLKITKSFRTEYDHIMLQIHDRMKADLSYQKNAPQQEIHFVPNTTWIVQTDHVSHAAMSGQHLLEQTFYLPVAAMQKPALSPLHTLERLMGHTLTT